MRLLFDQNLSFELVRLLSGVYPDSAHVRDLELDEADDFAIWCYAAEHGLVIVSKDSDFHGLSLLRGHPPKTVWLRVGNAPTSTIAALLRERHGAALPRRPGRRGSRSGVRAVYRPVSARAPRPSPTTSPTSSKSSRSPTARGPSSVPEKRGWDAKRA